MKRSGITNGLKIIYVHHIDPNIETIGGGWRYMHCLLKQSLKKGARVKFIGLKLGRKELEYSSDFTFIPMVNGTDKWWKYFIASFLKVPFLDVEPDETIHAQRLLYLLPYVLFHPSNPKICTSDQPLVTASNVYPKPLYLIISRLFSRIERFIMKRINAVIAQDDVLRGYYEVRYPDMREKLRYEINPAAGVNTDLFRPLGSRMSLRKDLGIAPEERVILFVGRLSPVKRVDFLIDAFVEFSRNNPESRFLIVGRGENEFALRLYAEKLQRCSIEFMGEKLGADLINTYNCADVLVMASQTEGNPTVVREALACGVPVVSTKVGDVGEIVDDPHLGKVVAYNADAKEFADAVTDVLRLDRERVEDVCRERAFKFSEEESFKSTYQLYLQLAGRN